MSKYLPNASQYYSLSAVQKANGSNAVDPRLIFSEPAGYKFCFPHSKWFWSEETFSSVAKDLGLGTRTTSKQFQRILLFIYFLLFSWVFFFYIRRMLLSMKPDWMFHLCDPTGIQKHSIKRYPVSLTETCWIENVYRISDKYKIRVHLHISLLPVSDHRGETLKCQPQRTQWDDSSETKANWKCTVCALTHDHQGELKAPLHRLPVHLVGKAGEAHISLQILLQL